MALVDSSVWIDFYRCENTLQTDRLAFLLRTRTVLIGDLVLAEVLQGFTDAKDFENARSRFVELRPVVVSSHRVAMQAARNYRTLRTLGITVRKTIDTLIATRCILDGIPLLYSDRDFDPFREHLGLIDALTGD